MQNTTRFPLGYRLGLIPLLVALAITAKVSAQDSDSPAPQVKIEEVRLLIETSADTGALQRALEEVERDLKPTQKAELPLERLAQLLLLKVDLLVTLGREREALEFLSGLAQQRGGAETPRHAACAKLLRENPELRSRYDTLRRRLEQRPPDAGLALTIRTALEQKDMALLNALGPRAVPPVFEWVDQHTSAVYTQVTDDPLSFLSQLAPERVGRLALRHWQDGGYIWRRRVLGILLTGSHYFFRGDDLDDSHPLAPSWLDVLARFVADDEMRTDCLDVVRLALRRKRATPNLIAALQTIVMGADRAAAREVMTAIDESKSSDPRLLPLLERAMGQGDSALRLAALASLQRIEGADPLAYAGDPDPEVRKLVAQGLRRAVALPDSGTRPLSRREWDVLEQLLADEDADVRLESLFILPRGNSTLALERWKQLAADEDPRVRRRVAEFASSLPPEYAIPICEVALRDPALRDTVESLLVSADVEEDPQGWLGVYAALLSDPSSRIAQEIDRKRNLARHFNTTPQTQEAYLRWALAAGPDALVAPIRDDKDPGSFLGRIPSELYPPFVVRLFHEDPFDLDRRLATEAYPRDPALDAEKARRAMQAATDRELPPELRYLLVLYSYGEPGWSKLMTSILLENPSLAEAFQSDASPLYNSINHWHIFDGEPVNRVLLSLLQEDAFPEPILSRITSAYDVKAPLALAISRNLIERFTTAQPSDSTGIDLAVESAGRHPELADIDELRSWLDKPWLTASAISALGQRHDPSALEDLAGFLRDRSAKDRLFLAALEAVTSYLSDEAAETLLDVAGQTRYRGGRDACLAAVESIRTYQEARERWAARRLGKQTRTRAVARLLELLDEKETEIRIEAIRGLGSLQALEALPTLIPLVRDPDPGIRKATREALDRLNSDPSKEEH